MSLAWIAEVVFFACYALGYAFNQSLPHNGWTFASALAAGIIAVLLVVDNRGYWNNRSPRV